MTPAEHGLSGCSTSVVWCGIRLVSFWVMVRFVLRDDMLWLDVWLAGCFDGQWWVGYIGCYLFKGCTLIKGRTGRVVLVWVSFSRHHVRTASGVFVFVVHGHHHGLWTVWHPYFRFVQGAQPGMAPCVTWWWWESPTSVQLNYLLHWRFGWGGFGSCLCLIRCCTVTRSIFSLWAIKHRLNTHLSWYFLFGYWSFEVPLWMDFRFCGNDAGELLINEFGYDPGLTGFVYARFCMSGDDSDNSFLWWQWWFLPAWWQWWFLPALNGCNDSFQEWQWWLLPALLWMPELLSPWLFLLLLQFCSCSEAWLGGDGIALHYDDDYYNGFSCSHMHLMELPTKHVHNCGIHSMEQITELVLWQHCRVWTWTSFCQPFWRADLW